jgi:hypothetical protein
MRRARFLSAGSLAGVLTAVAFGWPAAPPALGAPFAGPPAVRSCAPVGAVPTSSRGSFDGLYGVSALSNTDVWAVGRYIDAGSADKALVENWDGTRFRQVPSPDPQPNDVLLGVRAVSATDVWAVGKTWPATAEVFSPLIEHFDGRAWSVVPAPALRSGSGLLGGVAAGSAADVWAVGSQFSGPADANAATLTEHWDGTAWQVVSSPDPGHYGNYLDSVTVVSPRDAWAVGTAGTTAHGTATLIEHWDGTKWSVVPSPDVDIDDSLVSVSAVSASDVWAVGDYFKNTGGGSLVRTLALHFDGKRWSVIASPSPAAHNDFLAVAAASTRDVWAVGGNSGSLPALVEHWNGARWQVATEPYRHGNANYLYAVSAGTAPGVWAAGSFAGNQTLALHFCKP